MSRVREVLHRAKWKLPSGLPLPQRRALWYLWTFHRPGDFEDPQRFSEKMNWRILNDRSDELAWTCDKLAMKDRARELAPGIRVPKTLWVGDDVSDLARADLPERWVLKSNHGSHDVHLGRGRPNVAELREKTARWLDPWHSEVLGEWAYSVARRTMFVEEWIGDGHQVPTDYKVYTYRGEPRYVEAIHDRYDGLAERFYNTQWEPLDACAADCPLAPVAPAPAGLPQLLEYAAAIGRDFDFMRVDLYDVEGEVWFGETSPYVGGGLERWSPDAFDFALGEAWQLPEKVVRSQSIRANA